ncbi:MAG TPA: polyphosphate polymerase domain-containing protein [Myxococcota bacterium]|nr:polyphosphate polymerase domain-containing protein [Myxococcota bacterium]
MEGNRTEVISRYESKYLVPSSVVPAMRDYISAFCSPDRHVDPDGRYVVNNLYFETPDLRFYNDTRLKRFTRFKPRCRFYGDGSDGFLWLELKHKVANVTWKIRRRIPVGGWDDLFMANRFEPGRVEPGLNGARTAARRVKVVESFEDAVITFGAAPFLFVKYQREPYVSDVNAYARITFDRQLSYCMAEGSSKLDHGRQYIYYDDGATALHVEDESPVLVEIKTETSVPTWVMGMIGRFDLSRRGFSKYCQAVDHFMCFNRPQARNPAIDLSRRLFR